MEQWRDSNFNFEEAVLENLAIWEVTGESVLLVNFFAH